MKHKRLFAWLLVLVLALSALPAWAADGDVCPNNPDGRHEFVKVEEKAATCTANGYVKYRCRYCRKEYQDILPALGHSWGPWAVTQPATCTEDGLQQSVCYRDKSHVTFAKIPALGHEWGSWTVTEPATCTEDGLRESVCGRDPSHVQQEVVPALGHDWSEWYVAKAPTLTEPGILERICNRCGLTEQQPIPMLGEKEQYSLALVMVQSSPEVEAYDYEDLMDEENGIVIVYLATLINTGTEPLYVYDYSAGPGMELVTLPSPVLLEPGQSDTIILPRPMSPSDMIEGSASEVMFGVTEYDFYFYGDSEDGPNHVCVSNTESFEYKVKEPQGATDWTIPSESQVTVGKTLMNEPADPAGYQLGEVLYYHIYVQNTGEVPIPGLTLHDALATEGTGSDEVLKVTDLQPGESYPYSYTHVVDEDDVNQGYIYNIAYATWEDPASKTALKAESNPVIATISNNASLVLQKAVVGGPGNEQYYVPGEIIHFQVHVWNNSNVHHKSIVVVDPLTGESRTIDELLPDAHETLNFDYEVSEFDAVMTYVENYAYAMEVPGAVSNTVRVDTGFDVPFGVITELAVAKTETSTYSNGLGYELNDTITYVITVTNTGETPIVEGIVLDSLAGYGEIGSFENLMPGSSREFYYSHVVTESDVKEKKVINKAVVWYDHNGSGGVVESLPVESPTWGEAPDVVMPPLVPGDDHCQRTLNAKGETSAEYTLHYCAEHAALAEELMALGEAVSDETEELAFLIECRERWQGVMDKLYDQAMENADSATAASLLSQRLAWREYMGTYEALLTALYPQEPLVVAQELAEQTLQRSVDLCYELHAAPEARPDSYLGEYEAIAEAATFEACDRVVSTREGADIHYREELCFDHAALEGRAKALWSAANTTDARVNAFLRTQRLWQVQMDLRTNAKYKAADDDLKALIARNRIAFDKLLTARKALLEQLYPDSPATVAEVIAKAVMDKELDLCRLWK